ncbi:MAG: hypothetical protein WD875_04640 [Pirellulales bacterium]
MNRPNPFLGRTICLAVAVLLATTTRSICLPVWGNDVGEDKSTKASERDAPKDTPTDASLDAMIDALASRNPPPKIVKYISEWEAVFDAKYDWKEQDRVVAAIRAVLKNSGPKTWERLNAHGSDERYCLTFNDQAENADAFATNWTVGEMCGAIAGFQFGYPIDEATKSTRIGERPVDLPLEAIEGMPKWGQPLGEKTLVDLQIQACQQAIDDLPKLAAKAKESGRDANTDAETLQACRRRLEATIEKLKKSKSPLLGEFRFTGERFDLFDAKQAAEMRARYDAAKQRGEVK